MKIKKIIIPAAGLGTRLLPFSKCLPKELVPIFDVPALQLVIEEALEAGIKEIFVITSKKKKKIFQNYFSTNKELNKKLEHNIKKKEFFDSLLRIYKIPKITYIIQKKPLGLADAIYKARKFIKNEPFIVSLPDEIYVQNKKNNVLKQLIKHFEKNKKSLLLAKKVTKENVSKYGIIKLRKFDKKTNLGVVDTIVEKPEYSEIKSQIASMGRYIFTSDLFDEIAKIKIGKSGEFELPSAIMFLQKKGDINFLVVENDRFDLGSKLGFYKAFISFSLEYSEKTDIIKFTKNLINREEERYEKK